MSTAKSSDQFKDIENYAKDIGDSDEKLRLSEVSDLADKWRTTGTRLAGEKADAARAEERAAVEQEYKQRATAAGAADVDDLIRTYGERGTKLSEQQKEYDRLGVAGHGALVSGYETRGSDITGLQSDITGLETAAQDTQTAFDTKYGELQSAYDAQTDLYGVGGDKDYAKSQWELQQQKDKVTGLETMYGEGGEKDYAKAVQDLADQQTAFNTKYGDLQTSYGDLKGQYGDLEGKYSDLQGDYSGLEGKYSGLQGTHEGLQGTYSDLEGKYSGLEGKYSDLQGDYSGLEGKYSNLQGTHEGLKGDYSGLQGTYSDLEGKYSGLKGDYAGLQSTHEGLQGRYGELQDKYGTGGTHDYQALQRDYGNLQGEHGHLLGRYEGLSSSQSQAPRGSAGTRPIGSSSSSSGRPQGYGQGGSAPSGLSSAEDRAALLTGKPKIQDDRGVQMANLTGANRPSPQGQSDSSPYDYSYDYSRGGSNTRPKNPNLMSDKDRMALLTGR